MNKAGYRPEIPAPSPAKLPINETALVIIDMQNDFCRPDGSLFVGDMILPTIPKIKALLNKARSVGMRVIHTQSWHPADDPRFMENPHPRASIGSKGCKVDTWGADIVDVLNRLNFGTFEHGSAQRNRMRHNCNVIVTGTNSDVCVDKAVTGFFFRGYQIIVPVDCIATKNQFAQDSALYRFANHFAVTLTTSDLIEFH